MARRNCIFEYEQATYSTLPYRTCFIYTVLQWAVVRELILLLSGNQ